jgi:methenyltetrahydromethanopterin cyclohydrolase
MKYRSAIRARSHLTDKFDQLVNRLCCISVLKEIKRVKSKPSLDETVVRAHEKCRVAIQRADEIGLVVRSVEGATVLDFGVQRPGTLAGGLALAEICLAGLAEVTLAPQYDHRLHLPAVAIHTSSPLLACIASQYAGWPFSEENYFAMCSGPARMNRGQEPILNEYGLLGRFTPAIGVFECNSLPQLRELAAFAKVCDVKLEQVIVCVAPTASFPGTLQVVARSIETTLHKLHELKFDLTTMVAATGLAPLPPLCSDDLVALGWTNDSILYGGCVNLWLDTTDEAIEKVLNRLPSSSSTDFGDPFLETFNRYQKDFYKIDRMLFSPARVVLNNIRTGRVFTCGEIRIDILKRSFGFPCD